MASKFKEAVLSFEELMQLERIASATAHLPICQRLTAFMDHRKWNTVRFAELTEFDGSTYSRIKNNHLKRPDLRTIIAICVGLPLPLHIVQNLLDSAGLSFGNSEEGRAYRYIITEMHGCTVYEANLFSAKSRGSAAWNPWPGRHLIALPEIWGRFFYAR